MIAIQAKAPGSANTATPNATFGAAVTTGNAIIVWVSWFTASGSVTSVTDNLGNTYTSMGARVQSGNTGELWAAFNVTGGTITVTGHLSSSQTSALCVILEVTGISSSQDGYATAHASSNLVNAGSITTTNANDFLVQFMRGGTLANIDPGWSNQPSDGNGMFGQYKVVGATGTYSGKINLAASTTWVSAIAAFKANLPTASVQAATSVTSNSATLNGTIVSSAAGNCVIAGFNFGLTTSYGATVQNTGSFGTGTFSVAITGLQPNTTYHVQAFAENVGGYGLSADTTFTTTAGSGPPSPPTYSKGEVLFNSTQLGTAGQDVTGTKASLIDADKSTYWQTTITDNFDWVGVDCGTATNLTRVRISPMNECLGIQVQGSNDSTFATGAAVLATITSPPPPGQLQKEYAISIPYNWTFRYYRIWCNYARMFLADLDFIGNYTSGVTAAAVQPDMTPPGGYYDKPIRVRLSCLTTDANIYYTTDNSTPTTSSTLYTVPFVAPASANTNVRAIATSASLTNSRVSPNIEGGLTADYKPPWTFFIPSQSIPGKNIFDVNRGYRLNRLEGSILKDPVSGYWYAYGTCADGGPGSPFTGESVYRSADLINWEWRGMIMGPASLGYDSSLIHQDFPNLTLHRTQVLYNAANNNYVAWTADYQSGAILRYHRSWTSSSPDGPFTLVTTFNSGVGGRAGTGLDFGSFVDPTNGQPYLIWVNNGSGSGTSMSFAKLNAAYTDVQTGAGNMYTIDYGVNQREAPTMFYRNGTYFLMFTDQTGGAYTHGYYTTASSPLGPWDGTQTNPFQTSTVEDKTLGYHSQCSQVIKIPGRDDGTGKGAFLYDGSGHSIPTATGLNTHLWLPIVFPTDSTMTISWDTYLPNWTLDGIFPTVSGAPLAATGLSASWSGLNASIAWANNETAPKKIYIDRADDSAFTIDVESEVLADGTTSFIDTMVGFHATLYYRIRTVNSSGTTNSASVSLSPPMTLLSITDATIAAIGLEDNRHLPVIISDTSMVVLGVENKRRMGLSILGTSAVVLHAEINPHFAVMVADGSVVFLGLEDNRHLPLGITDSSSVVLGIRDNRHLPVIISDTSSVVLGREINQHFAFTVVDGSVVLLGLEDNRRFPLAMSDASIVLLHPEIVVRTPLTIVDTTIVGLWLNGPRAGMKAAIKLLT